MITLFPMRQLWPMCAPAIRKFLSPILVALPSGLPRWIVQFDLQKLGGFSQTSRQAVVCLAGRRIAGRMIMHYDDIVSRSDQRGPKDVARMSDTFVYASHRDFLHSNQMITRIEQDHA